MLWYLACTCLNFPFLFICGVYDCWNVFFVGLWVCSSGYFGAYFLYTYLRTSFIISTSPAIIKLLTSRSTFIFNSSNYLVIIFQLYNFPAGELTSFNLSNFSRIMSRMPSSLSNYKHKNILPYHHYSSLYVL